MGKVTGNWINDDVVRDRMARVPRNVEKAKQLLRRPAIRTASTSTGSRRCRRSTRAASASSRSSARSASAAACRPWSAASSSSSCRRAQGVPGRPDHPARRADRGQLVVLVRGELQVRRLQLARPHLREGPRRQVRPVRAVDQSGRAQKLAEEIQRAILENYYLVPVFRHAFVNAINGWRHRRAGRLSDHHHRLRLSWEDLKVKSSGRHAQFIARRSSTASSRSSS